MWLCPSPWLLALTAVGIPRLGVVSDAVRLYWEFAMRLCSLKLWELNAFLQGTQPTQCYSLSICLDMCVSSLNTSQGNLIITANAFHFVCCFLRQQCRIYQILCLIKYLSCVLLQFISQEQRIHTGRDHDFIKVALKKRKRKKRKKCPLIQQTTSSEFCDF